MPRRVSADNRPVEITMPALHPGQQQLLECQKRFIVVACGRRWGKTQFGAAKGVATAVMGGKVWWVAPDYQRAQPGYEVIKGMVLAIKKQWPEVEWLKSDAIFTFPNGGSLQIKTGQDPQTLRGAGLDGVILDECAFMHPDVWNEAVQPALADRRGWALFPSTPHGRNHFYQWYQKGLSGDPDWASFQFPTSTNPFIPPDEIKRFKSSMSDRYFRQEFLAEFIDDASSVFRGVHEAATGQVGQPQQGHLYLFGLDWGREKDFTVVSVFDVNDKRMVFLDRYNKVGWDLQRGRIMNLFSLWRPTMIWAEENSIGSVNIEALEKEGLPIKAFNMNGVSKKPLIEAWALAIERGDVTLLDDQNLINEHLSYEVEVLPSGAFRYNAPIGAHDDTVIASALGWYGVTQTGTRTTYSERVGVSGLYNRVAAAARTYQHGYKKGRSA